MIRALPLSCRSAVLGLLLWVYGIPVMAEEPDPLAVAFGTFPDLWGVQMSPNGEKVSFLQMHAQDLPVLKVFDLKTGTINTALASTPNEFDIYWCGWANDTRLLCGFYAIERGWMALPATRLVAVNADGSEQKVLLERKLKKTIALFQDQIIDWLVDEPRHVLVSVPDKRGSSAQRLDIYSGGTAKRTTSKAGVSTWVSDGHGSPRLYHYWSVDEVRWYYRAFGKKRWHLLHKADTADLDDDYYPVGFGDNPDTLYLLKPHDGRLALWAKDLAQERDDTLVFSHPEVDIGGSVKLGKFNRTVAIAYSTDRWHLHFFDEIVERISDRLGDVFPGKLILVIDESWDRRYYIVHVGSDLDPGTYYRFDTQENQLMAISPQYPLLGERTLAPMKPIHYESRDSAQIPGYLTLPVTESKNSLPAVILPHGGPESRDYWGFDWLPQFLAARGYAVLQSNFRGSGGYGRAWIGEGGFREWKKAVNDLTDGAQHLIDTGVADPNRLCTVGWSYGGYVALLSAVEEAERYRCVVSIAGVTDPTTLIKQYERYYNQDVLRAYIGTGKDVLQSGSPMKRASELRAPVLLFHGDLDINVSIDHSKKMAQALKRAKKPVTLITYQNVEHSIRRNEYRIDMLNRIGLFLDAHIGSPAQSSNAPGNSPAH